MEIFQKIKYDLVDMHKAYFTLTLHRILCYTWSLQDNLFSGVYQHKAPRTVLDWICVQQHTTLPNNFKIITEILLFWLHKDACVFSLRLGWVLG